MKIVDRKGEDQIFSQFWQETKEELFKVEVLQYYAEDEGEILGEWLKGNKKKAIELLKQLPSWVGEGKEDIKKIRIHVIEKPLTSYLECEIACYKHWNIPIVGEDVYLVDKEKLGGMWLPAGDTLIFDNKNVIENIYDERGFCTGAKIIEDKEELKPYLEMKENLMKGKLEEV